MKSTLLIFVLFLSAFLILKAQSTKISQCPSGGNLPDDVQIENCDQEPCTFYLGTNTSMTMKFKAPRKLVHIAPNGLAHVMGIDVSYPLNQDDACDGITNTKCPVEKNQEVEYTYGMSILPIFPEITLTLEFSLQDKDNGNENIECFQIDIKIKKL